MRENEQDSSFIFLVGTKSDLLVSIFNIMWTFYRFHGPSSVHCSILLF